MLVLNCRHVHANIPFHHRCTPISLMLVLKCKPTHSINFLISAPPTRSSHLWLTNYMYEHRSCGTVPLKDVYTAIILPALVVVVQLWNLRTKRWWWYCTRTSKLHVRTINKHTRTRMNCRVHRFTVNWKTIKLFMGTSLNFSITEVQWNLSKGTYFSKQDTFFSAHVHACVNFWNKNTSLIWTLSSGPMVYGLKRFQ